MEGICLPNFPKLPVWIVEHIWAHKMMELQEVLDASLWLDVDSQPLSLEDSWRLRVASAQVFSIMKKRAFQHFERIVAFLEATHRLLPRLVSPIKHMKIVFGLKTMVVMWMLRERKGMIDTVFKTIHFFPSKLPMYQDQCSQHEMFLMRKNQQDFKVLAQTLAMNKEKLEDYIKNQMERQYGESYAQKVEERLLHYLQELEAVLPRDTYIDKIIKKNCPVTEEEKLLLEVITSDSITIATTLQKLLHCDVAFCRPIGASQKSENREEMGKSQLPNSGLSTSPLKAGPSSQVVRGNKLSQDTSKDRLVPEEYEYNLGGEETNVVPMLMRDNGNSSKEKWKVGQEKGVDVEKEEISGCSEAVVSSPQFCSKHQRWVKSILQECADEVSEDTSSSPILFPSSSSTSSSSSQDLTPSGLTAGHGLPDQKLPPSAASEHRNPEGQLRSGPSGPQSKPLPQPASSWQTLPSPVVQLINVSSVRGIYSTFNLQEASLNCFNMSSKNQEASRSGSQVLNSSYHLKLGNKESGFTLVPTSPLNATVDDVAGCHVYPFSATQSRTISSTCSRNPSFTDSSGPVVLQNSMTKTRPLQLKTLPGVPCSSSSNRQLRFLLQNQPNVSLTRLNTQECHRLTNGRSSIRHPWSVVHSNCYHDNEEGDMDSSFDPNTLYSSHSSSNDTEDSPGSDLEYKP